MTVVPVFTFFVALWLLAFYFMNAGKLVNYISAPVMGGFITGICTTIILMQAPKLMGSAAGTGELFELSEHIWEAFTPHKCSRTCHGDCSACHFGCE